MEAHLYQSPADFDAAAWSVYRPDPVLFTLELTTLHITPWPAERILLSVGNGNDVEGAAVQTRDSVLLVNGLPPGTAMTAAETLAAVTADLSGCAEHRRRQRLSHRHGMLSRVCGRVSHHAMCSTGWGI